MHIKNRNEVPEFITLDTSHIREILAPANSDLQRQSLAEASLPPGASTFAHYHPNTEEIYYILSGTGLMAVEDSLQAVHPLDAVSIPAGKKHQIRNAGTDELVFLCCCVPAYTDEDTVLCDALL